MADATRTTRFAPSPTGALHLGNARTFVLNWLLAKRFGWRILMRVEDLDGPRVKAGVEQQMLDELRWLGLTWDGPVVRQSQRTQKYRAALDALVAAGAAYPCVCSRKDVELAAGAPHSDDGSAVYAGLCRGLFRTAEEASAATNRPAAWRLAVDDAEIAFEDAFAGRCRFRLAQTCGDFVIVKSDGTAAYQLAVVVDDAEAGVTDVVRGDDLLESAARQIYLRRLLKLSPEPTYWHFPLVIGPDGRRLAKRHGDTRIAHYRQRGATPQRIAGLIAYWSGLTNRREEISVEGLLEKFDIRLLPRTPVAFSPDDDRFLLGR
jgi:glutamyl-tRNA synthetase